MELDLISKESLFLRRFSPLYFLRPRTRPLHGLPFPIGPCPSPYSRKNSLISHAKKRNASVKPFIKETPIIKVKEAEEEIEEGAEEEYIEDFGDEILVDDNEEFEEDFEGDDENVYVGDGGEGGGISLAGTWWDKEALTLAEEVSMSFDGDLKIYAFKTLANSTIRLRIEKLSSKYGSPSMADIEAFTSAYQVRLDEAEHAGSIPENISLEVSSPGVERVVRVPEELERFKDKPMHVRYAVGGTEAALPQESDGVFRLISFDLESCYCTWGVADVRINRAKAGKGRPLSKKQREWRLETPFDSLRLVRIYSDC